MEKTFHRRDRRFPAAPTGVNPRHKKARTAFLRTGNPRLWTAFVAPASSDAVHAYCVNRRHLFQCKQEIVQISGY